MNRESTSVCARKLGRTLCIIVLSLLALAVGGRRIYADTSRVERLAGADRYATAVEASKKAKDKSNWTILCTGENFPDALPATPLSGIYDCTILFSQKGSLPSVTKTELQRLGSKNVHIMGGEAALSAGVESSLKGMGITTNRVAGVDRFETSAKALSLMRAAGSKSETVVVTTGMRPNEALLINSWARKTKSPIILVGKNGKLSQPAIDAIKKDGGFNRVVFVGNGSAVSNEVTTQLGKGFKFERLSGGDDNELTSVVAEWTSGSSLDWGHPVVATGENYADALAAGALAGRMGSPVILVYEKSMKAQAEYPTWDAMVNPVVDLVRKHRDEIDKLYIVGGTAAVSKEIESALKLVLTDRDIEYEYEEYENYDRYVVDHVDEYEGYVYEHDERGSNYNGIII